MGKAWGKEVDGKGKGKGSVDGKGFKLWKLIMERQ